MALSTELAALADSWNQRQLFPVDDQRRILIDDSIHWVASERALGLATASHEMLRYASQRNSPRVYQKQVETLITTRLAADCKLTASDCKNLTANLKIEVHRSGVFYFWEDPVLLDMLVKRLAPPVAGPAIPQPAMNV